MATVSLIDTGKIMGRTTGQTVKLSLLRDNGYARTLASDGYLRVNPYEIEAGRGQDPDEAGSEHRLGDWDGYDKTKLPAGSNLEDSQGGYDVADVAWSAPSGATRAPEIVGFKVYLKDTGLAHTSAPTESETSTDPTDTPDATDEVGFEASVVEDAELGASGFAGNWVAIAVVSLFDDSVTKHEDTEGASAKAGETALTGATEGILAKVFSSTPSIDSVNQTTDPDTCTAGDDVNLRLQITMEGSSQGTLQESVDGGAFSTVDSAVPAGTSTINLTRASGHNYQYRLRYNDVSPDSWDTSSTESAVCNLV